MLKQNTKNIALLSIVGILFGSTVSYANATETATPTSIEFYNGDSELDYTVDYEGSSYDAVTERTTFTYSLSVFTDPALSHWSLEFACTDGSSALVDGSIATVEYGSFMEPAIGSNINGIKFDDGQEVGTTLTYTVTLLGEIGEGEVWAYAKGGNVNAGGNYVADYWDIVGPSCQEPQVQNTTYSIDGTIFVDANQNGIADIDEPVIGKVTVSLYDTEGNLIQTTTTDTSGFYVFDGLNTGDYLVVVESSTEAEDDFNETLFEEFDSTTPAPIQVSITNSNSTTNDFGFAPDFTAICEVQNEDGLCALSGDGKTIGFWKHQNAVAIKDKGKAHIDGTTLEGYHTTISGLFLPQSFQITSFQDALDILKSTSSEPVDLLNKQLLATEYNLVYGIGIDDTQLQSLLIAWGEYLSAHSDEFTSEELLDAKDIFDGINNSGNN
jgi:hypothetical protein